MIFLWGTARFCKRFRQEMITKNHKLFMSTTAVSVLSGIVLAIAYMATNEQKDISLLVIAQFVVVACLLGWLFSMLLLMLPSVARYLTQGMLVLQRAYLPDQGPDWEMIRVRREMIAIRLGVDDPVFCSKRGISCNCWSFCGGDPDISTSQNTLEPDHLVRFERPKREAEIEDRNVSDCTFL